MLDIRLGRDMVHYFRVLGFIVVLLFSVQNGGPTDAHIGNVTFGNASSSCFRYPDVVGIPRCFLRDRYPSQYIGDGCTRSCLTSH